jgi:hypothetical protein
LIAYVFAASALEILNPARSITADLPSGTTMGSLEVIFPPSLTLLPSAIAPAS